MLILPQMVSVKWNANNIKYFTELGYNYTTIGDEFSVYVLDLPETSKVKVEMFCDYCLCKFTNPLKLHTKSMKSTIKKYSCGKCGPRKQKDSVMLKYGVSNVSEIPSIRRKAEDTNLKLYGVKNITQSRAYVLKQEETCFKNYGVRRPLQNEHVKNKQENTLLTRFGVRFASQSKELRMRTVSTVNERYGVDNVFANKDIIKKIRETMFKNKTTPSSRQQDHIHNLIGGELNYPCGSFMIDIAFPNEKIGIEFDGSGHDLLVKKGNISQDQFIKNERRRYGFLKYSGWKMVRIVSLKDLLPSDDTIIDIINNCKKTLTESDDKYIEIHISSNSKDMVYGELRRLKRE